MTDEEIVRAVAEKVMQWKLGPDFVVNGGRLCPMLDEYRRPDHIAVEWNPLADDRDSCAVLEKMAADKWTIQLTFYPAASVQGRGSWGIALTPPSIRQDSVGGITHEDRRRAICLAALKAVGATP